MQTISAANWLAAAFFKAMNQHPGAGKVAGSYGCESSD